MRRVRGYDENEEEDFTWICVRREETRRLLIGLKLRQAERIW